MDKNGIWLLKPSSKENPSSKELIATSFQLRMMRRLYTERKKFFLDFLEINFPNELKKNN
jgi:hypothetical protein